MIRRGVLAAVLAILLGGGTVGCSRACPAALLTGVLVADGPDLLGLQGGDGAVWHVRWPAGVGTRVEGGGLALTDAFGTVLARAGDTYELPGGQNGNDGTTWAVCGDLKHLGG